MVSPYELLWKDKMDIYRFTESIVNNVTKSSEQLIASDIKCHYSKGSLTDIGIDGTPTLINSQKLFCSFETDLKEGDKVIVTQRNGKKITLKVGEGFPYTNKKEFAAKRDDKV